MLCIQPAFPTFIQQSRWWEGEEQEEMRMLRTWRVRRAFCRGCDFTGPQLSSHWGSTNWSAVSEPFPRSFENFFSDGTFMLSVVTSEFWKQLSPFNYNQAGPVIICMWIVLFIAQGAITMPCFIYSPGRPWCRHYYSQVAKEKSEFEEVKGCAELQNRFGLESRSDSKSIAFYSTQRFYF